MDVFKKEEIIFKLKDISSKIKTKNNKITSNKGFNCSVMGKSELIKFMNTKVLVKNPYPISKNRSEKLKYNVDANAKHIMQKGICVIMEILMRYFNDYPTNDNSNKKVWFMDIETSTVNKLKTL